MPSNERFADDLVLERPEGWRTNGPDERIYRRKGVDLGYVRRTHGRWYAYGRGRIGEPDPYLGWGNLGEAKAYVEALP